MWKEWKSFFLWTNLVYVWGFVSPSNLRPPEKVGYEALCWKWNSDILQLLEFMIDIPSSSSSTSIQFNSRKVTAHHVTTIKQEPETSDICGEDMLQAIVMRASTCTTSSKTETCGHAAGLLA
jgi:hypothetical protein